MARIWVVSLLVMCVGCGGAVAGHGRGEPHPTTTITPPCAVGAAVPRSGAGPLRYHVPLALPGTDVVAEFVAVRGDSAVLSLRRGDCAAPVLATVAEGRSARALGLTLTVQRLLPSAHGVPPQVDIDYRFR